MKQLEKGGVPLGCIALLTHIRLSDSNINDYFKIVKGGVNPKLTVSKFKEIIKSSGFRPESMDELIKPLLDKGEKDTISLGKLIEIEKENMNRISVKKDKDGKIKNYGNMDPATRTKI
jgi:hypothetical protein